MEQLANRNLDGGYEMARRLRLRLWVERGLFVGLVAAGLAYYFLVSSRTAREACIISIDGKPAVVVANQATADHLLEQIRRTAGAIPEVGFAQRVTFQLVAKEGTKTVPEAAALQLLSTRLTLITPGVGVFVNNRLRFGFADRQQAIGALSLLLQELSPPDPDLSRAFREKVNISATQIPVSMFLPSADAALTTVRKAMAEKKQHTVHAGDSAWKISSQYGITIEHLKQANPTVNFARLQVGELVTIPVGTAPLTVVAWKEVEQPIAGSKSGRTQVIRVTYINGVQSDWQVIRRSGSEDEAQTTIRRKSTRRRPTSEEEHTTPKHESRTSTDAATRDEPQAAKPEERGESRAATSSESTPSWQR